MLNLKDGGSIQLKDADLCHRFDAVQWWNEVGKYYGPTPDPRTRAFMTDPRCYYLGRKGPNRSAGARLRDTYDPPAPSPEGPPQEALDKWEEIMGFLLDPR
jgi:hypothetical protein